jgi:hypothetical protein
MMTDDEFETYATKKSAKIGDAILGALDLLENKGVGLVLSYNNGLVEVRLSDNMFISGISRVGSDKGDSTPLADAVLEALSRVDYT